jgi:2-polyprenyl-3-methyl-5-hydroxy-6-metoxy-1,4-benzoquinol methylase
LRFNVSSLLSLDIGSGVNTVKLDRFHKKWRTQMAIDEDKLMAFMGQAVTDMSATVSVALMAIGDKLGLYKAMAGSGPLTPADIAERTNTNERYVREWLNNQVAGGYITYDPARSTYELEEEQAFALADEDSPVFIGGAFDVVGACWAAEEQIAEAFRTGEGMGWHEHHPRLFGGTERFFRPGYRANLTSSWIPALEGVEPKLQKGAKVADVGCGHGASTVIMAAAYPNSRFLGSDYHQQSIEAARGRATDAGVGDRVDFEVATAKDHSGEDLDLVCYFDCLHDMGDPVGAARHARQTLKSDGTVMLVEPFANDNVEDNVNPVGRMFYGASTFLCTPASLSQEVGLALGAQAGEARLREVFTEAGFSSFRRATETPFNLVLEAKP